MENSNKKLDDMIMGYRAGLNSENNEMPSILKKESAAFKHGWLNGRDDRLNKPRDSAFVIGKRADIILNN